MTMCIVFLAMQLAHALSCCELVESCEVDFITGEKTCMQYIDCDCQQKGVKP
jgi:hypothetical protein